MIYETLRNSPSWEETLLLITYDEHGGFYDSIPPTRTLKNPDPSSPGTPNKFDFDRSGPRVPAIAISPWLPKQVNSTIFEHSSIPATIKSFLNLSSPFLNARGKNHLILI
jgi:phospholipase C